MSSIVGEVSTLVAGAIGWMTEFISAVISQPLLMIGVCTSFVGLGVGLLRRLINIR